MYISSKVGYFISTYKSYLIKINNAPYISRGKGNLSLTQKIFDILQDLVKSSELKLLYIKFFTEGKERAFTL